MSPGNQVKPDDATPDLRGLRLRVPPGSICAVNPRVRFAVIAVVLSVVGGVAWLSGRSDAPAPASFPSGTATPTQPVGCIEDPPAKRSTPSWFPKSIPLPAGTYVHDVPEQTAPGVHTAQLFMPVSLDAFVKLVLGTWKAKGWTPGVGEREPGEAEDTFTGPGGLYGKFRASSYYCDADTTNLFIAIASQPDTSQADTSTPSP